MTDSEGAPAGAYDVRPPSEDYRARDRLRGQRIEILDAAKRLFTATWGATGRVFDFGDDYCEFLCDADAVVTDLVRGGIAPVLARHDDSSLEGQLGTLRACRIEGNQLRLIGQLGYSPTAEWLWRNLSAGIVYGCSIGCGISQRVKIDVAVPVRKPVWRATRWVVRELSICQAQRGRDDLAKVAAAADLRSLLERWLLADAELERRQRNALPDYYAEPLRRRVTDIAIAIAEHLGIVGVDAIERPLRAKLEAFIANCE